MLCDVLLTSLIVAWLMSGCAGPASIAGGPRVKAHAPAAEDQATPQALDESAPVVVMEDSPGVPVDNIKATAPGEYVVVAGDTLWDIASQFLAKPWYWPEIWQVNPQVKNPHLIYPGDVLSLAYVNGKPSITVSGGPRVAQDASVVRLAPRVRSEPLDMALPVQTVAPFTPRPRVVAKDLLDAAPYLLAAQDNHLIYSDQERLYVRGLEQAEVGAHYSVVRPGKPLVDPRTDQLIGHEAIVVGEAQVIRLGEPATVQLTRVEREALQGDRLLPMESEITSTYIPHAPQAPISGTVISLFDALSQVGQHQVAVLNLGTQDGLDQGHVLGAYQAGRLVRDPLTQDKSQRTVVLPEEKAGTLMVFRVFENVSYALVMDAQRPIHLGDGVSNP